MANSNLLKMTLRLCIVCLLVSFVVPLQGCAFFSEPAYEGQIIDIETKEPIEGASVVAIYMSEVMTPVQSTSKILNVQEAVTGKDGKFFLPSYTTMIMPLSKEDKTTFIVYKPGYLSINRLRIGDCFAGECKTRNMEWLFDNKIHYLLSNRKVELPRLTDKNDRRKAIPSFSYIDEKDAPHMKSLIKEEEDLIYSK